MWATHVQMHAAAIRYLVFVSFDVQGCHIYWRVVRGQDHILINTYLDKPVLELIASF